MDPKELVLKYPERMNIFEYDEAEKCLEPSVKAVGPSGNAFPNRRSFIGMMKSYQFRYDLKKAFQTAGMCASSKT